MAAGAELATSILAVPLNSRLVVSAADVDAALEGTEESDDIEHQLECHAETVPSLLRAYAAAICRVKDLTSKAFWDAYPDFMMDEEERALRELGAWLTEDCKRSWWDNKATGEIELLAPSWKRKISAGGETRADRIRNALEKARALG